MMIKKKNKNVKFVLKNYYTKCYGALNYNEEYDKWTYGLGENNYILKHYRNVFIRSLYNSESYGYCYSLLFIFNNQLLKINNKYKRYYFEFEMYLHKEVLDQISIKHQYLNKKYAYINISYASSINNSLNFSFLILIDDFCLLKSQCNLYFMFENRVNIHINKYFSDARRTIEYAEYLICVKKKKLFEYLSLLKKKLKTKIKNNHVKIQIVKNTFDFFNHKFFYDLYKKEIAYPLARSSNFGQSFYYFNYEKDLKNFYIIGDHLSCMPTMYLNFLDDDIRTALMETRDMKKYNIEKSKKFAKLGVGSLGLFYSFENYIYIP